MSVDRIIVTLGGLGAVAFVVWFSWLVKRRGTKAALVSSGCQEAMVIVKEGYTLDVIVVEHGRPVRLSFRRKETASCSEMVVFLTSTSPPSFRKTKSCRSSSFPTSPAKTSFDVRWGCFAEN